MNRQPQMGSDLHFGLLLGYFRMDFEEYTAAVDTTERHIRTKLGRSGVSVSAAELREAAVTETLNALIALSNQYEGRAPPRTWRADLQPVLEDHADSYALVRAHARSGIQNLLGVAYDVNIGADGRSLSNAGVSPTPSTLIRKGPGLYQSLK